MKIFGNMAKIDGKNRFIKPNEEKIKKWIKLTFVGFALRDTIKGKQKFSTTNEFLFFFHIWTSFFFWHLTVDVNWVNEELKNEDENKRAVENNTLKKIA